MKHPVIAFGSLCPGKRYALLQLRWYIIYMFTKFDLRFAEGVSPALYDDKYHGHEILPPIADVDCVATPRANAPELVFERQWSLCRKKAKQQTPTSTLEKTRIHQRHRQAYKHSFNIVLTVLQPSSNWRQEVPSDVYRKKRKKLHWRWTLYKSRELKANVNAAVAHDCWREQLNEIPHVCKSLHIMIERRLVNDLWQSMPAAGGRHYRWRLPEQLHMSEVTPRGYRCDVIWMTSFNVLRSRGAFQGRKCKTSLTQAKRERHSKNDVYAFTESLIYNYKNAREVTGVKLPRQVSRCC